MTVNTFLIRADVGWCERQDQSSQQAVGRIEALLGLGALSSFEEAFRVGDGQLAEFARVRTQTNATLKPIDSSEQPFSGFFTGDTISVEDPISLVVVNHRVLGLSASEDDNGAVSYVPTLNDDVVLSADERIAQALTKVAGRGTLGGRSKVAQPVIPYYQPRGLGAPVASEAVQAWYSINDVIGATPPASNTPSLSIGGDDGLVYLVSRALSFSSGRAVVYTYDPTTGLYAAYAQNSLSNSSPYAVVPLSGEVLVVTNSNAVSHGGSAFDSSLDVFSLDTGGNSWSNTRAFTLGASSAGNGSEPGFAFDGTKLYLCPTAVPDGSGGFTSRNIISIYDTGADSWSNGAAMPNPDGSVDGSHFYDGSGAASSRDGLIYWGMGWQTSGRYPPRLFAYDPGGNSWQTVNLPADLIAWSNTNISSANNLWLAELSDGSIVVGMGWGIAGASMKWWRFIPDGTTDPAWENLATLSLFSGFHEPEAVAGVGGSIFCWASAQTGAAGLDVYPALP